ncbi:MAG: hypothetical protein AAF959_30285 [Cyanobacteria bacterium P01_D01_bin.56]
MGIIWVPFLALNIMHPEQPTPKSDVTKLVDRLIVTKKISYQQYQDLSRMVMADGTVDEQERRQINRLFDAIQAGAVRIID